MNSDDISQSWIEAFPKIVAQLNFVEQDVKVEIAEEHK